MTTAMKNLKIQIFKCFMVHYNQGTLTIRAEGDGSGEQSGTCRPYGSSNGSSRITVWVILYNIIKRHHMSHLSHFPLTSSFSQSKMLSTHFYPTLKLLP
jgi:hypothetical protein